jgi:uncharacterized membrane protein
MPSCDELKSQALAKLKGHWFFGCGVWLTFFVIMFSLFFVVALLIAIMGLGIGEILSWSVDLSIQIVISPLLTIGVAWTFLEFVRNGDTNLSSVFEPFSKCCFKMVGAYWLLSLYVMLWMLLLIIPGLVKSLAYSQTFYILKDNPQLSANQAIGYSKKLMNGHKVEYLVLLLSFWGWFILIIVASALSTVLLLSFFGWFILSICTIGIGIIGLASYVATTCAVFYDNLKKCNPELISNVAENKQAVEQP